MSSASTSFSHGCITESLIPLQGLAAGSVEAMVWTAPTERVKVLRQVGEWVGGLFSRSCQANMPACMQRLLLLARLLPDTRRKHALTHAYFPAFSQNEVDLPKSQHKYGRGLLPGVATVVREQGIFGVYRGWVPTAARQASSVAVRFMLCTFFFLLLLLFCYCCCCHLSQIMQR